MTVVEQLDRWVHRVHGTRSLLAAALVLLVLALIEPVLPPSLDRAWLAGPALALLAIGFVTLPREAVGAQDRARALLEHPEPHKPMRARLVWLALLLLLLLPRVFLAIYGIPHMSPLTGLVLPSMLNRVSVAGMFVLVLVPVLYLRSSRRYAPHVANPMAREEPGRRIEAMALAVAAVTVAWAVLLHGFWAPFTLLEAPPSLDSLSAGSRGVAAITFALVPPAVLFVSAVTHLDLLWTLRQSGRRDNRILAYAVLHLALLAGTIALHAYDVLWVLRYEAAFGF